jgi:hypothetical protein
VPACLHDVRAGLDLAISCEVVARRATGEPPTAEPGADAGCGGAQRRRLDAMTIKVERSLTETAERQTGLRPAKTAAGVRTVAFPELVVPILRWHLDCFARPDADALVFTSAKGMPLRRSNFRRRV